MLNDGLDVDGPERLPARFEPVEIATALRQIHREVARGLEHPELPGPLERHAAGGHVCHRTVREFDARVRDVHVRGKDCHTGRPDLGDIGPHQLEDQVQVVDHQVEDDGDIGPAGLKRRQPIGLEETRLLEIWGRRANGPVEPLDVTNLEDQLLACRPLDQLLRPCQGVRQRFFHEQRPAPLQHGQSHAHVCGRRYGHGNGFRLVEQRVERGERGRFDLVSDLSRAGGIDVVDAHQLGPGHRRINRA